MHIERVTITAPAGVRAYAQLFAAPRVLPLVASSVVGRMPQGMSGLAIILDARDQHHGYATAGAWVAAYTMGRAAISPILGRAIDRIGEVRLLPPVGVAFGIVMAALAELLRTDVSPWLIGGVAFAAGGLLPPLGACMRTQWPRLLTEQSLSVGFSLDAIMVEVSEIGGPLLTAAIVAVSPTAAILASAAFGALGSLLFAWFVRPTARGATEYDRPDGHVLGSPGIRTVLVSTIGVGLAFGAVEIALPAFCEGLGHRALAGVGLATFSVGSMLGGIRFGAIPASVEVGRRYRVALWAFGALLLLPLLAWSIPAMVVIMAIAGLPIAPSLAASYMLVGRLSHPAVTTEAFSWFGTAIVAGVAIGNVGGGALAGAVGWRAAVGLAVATVVASAALVTVRRRSLR